MEYDRIVRNGRGIGGSGAPRMRADVAIKDGAIAEVMAAPDESRVTAARTIDATGLIVAPRFIDLHSHSDWVVPTPAHGGILRPFLMQGLTTFVGGNRGFSTP